MYVLMSHTHTHTHHSLNCLLDQLRPNSTTTFNGIPTKGLVFRIASQTSTSHAVGTGPHVVTGAQPASHAVGTGAQPAYHAVGGAQRVSHAVGTGAQTASHA